MYELAEELKKNSTKRQLDLPDGENGDEESDVDEQEEWNKQIEEDSKVLKATSQNGDDSCSPAKKLKI